MFGNVTPLPPAPAPDLLASLNVPMDNASADDPVADLPRVPPRRPRSRGPVPSNFPPRSLVERPHPGPFWPGLRPRPARSSATFPSSTLESPPRTPAPTVSSRAPSSMSDRVQAAFIDVGMWSAMSAIAFYFASRIAQDLDSRVGPPGRASPSSRLSSPPPTSSSSGSPAPPPEDRLRHPGRYDGSSLGSALLFLPGRPRDPGRGLPGPRHLAGVLGQGPSPPPLTAPRIPGVTIVWSLDSLSLDAYLREIAPRVRGRRIEKVRPHGKASLRAELSSREILFLDVSRTRRDLSAARTAFPMIRAGGSRARRAPPPCSSRSTSKARASRN